MWHDEREIAPLRLGLAKGQCARESARPGILGQGRGKTCRIGVGTCGGIGSPSSFSRLKTASRSSRLPFLLPNGRILTSILPFHTPIVYLIAYGVCGSADSATATVDGENCAGVGAERGCRRGGALLNEKWGGVKATEI